MRDGVCLSVEELLEAIENRKTGMSIGNLYGRMLVELLREEAMISFAKCVREWVVVDRSQVCDGEIQIVFVKSGFIRAGYCPTLKDYDRVATK